MKTRVLSLLPWAALLCACVGDSPVIPPQQDSGVPPNDGSSVPDTSPGMDAATMATLSIVPAAPFVRRSATLDITVTVDRQSVQGPIQLAVSGLPMGVTAGTIAPVPVGGTTTTLSLTASASATEGPAMVKLSAPGVVDFTFTLLVGGPSGSLDESFNGSGIVLETTLASGVFYGLAVQADGKLIAVGTANQSTNAWLVRRYGSDGMADAAFNTASGAVIPGNGQARAVAVDPKTNDVVVVGGSGSTEEMTAIRFLPTGAADLAFAAAGTMVENLVDFPGGGRAYAVLIASDSSMLLGGDILTQGQQGFVERFTSAGLRDTSTYLPYRTPDQGGVRALFLLKSGNVMVAGTDHSSSMSPPVGFLAARLSSGGSPDLLFGSAGTRLYSAGSTANGAALATSEDLLMVGSNLIAPSEAQTRIAQNGNTAFNQFPNGGLNIRFSSAASAGNDETYTTGFGGGSQDKFATVQMNKADGSIDTSFATTGTVTFQDPGTPDTYTFQLWATLVMPDGRIVVAGSRSGSASPGAIIMRLWP